MLAASDVSFSNQSPRLTGSEDVDHTRVSESRRPLSDRQELIAQMVARGETCTSAAEQLQLPIWAVEGHIHQILVALNLSSMTELTEAAVKRYRTYPGPEHADTASEYLTVSEIALNMRVSKMTVYRLVRSGALDSVRFGRSYRITQLAFQQYLDSLISTDTTTNTGNMTDH